MNDTSNETKFVVVEFDVLGIPYLETEVRPLYNEMVKHVPCKTMVAFRSTLVSINDN